MNEHDKIIIIKQGVVFIKKLKVPLGESGAESNGKIGRDTSERGIVISIRASSF